MDSHGWIGDGDESDLRDRQLTVAAASTLNAIKLQSTQHLDYDLCAVSKEHNLDKCAV